MLTKVGHARPMLICTDCGQPVDQRDSIAMARQRLWGALTLVGLTMVSGAMFTLATMYEWRKAGLEEGEPEKQEQAASDEGNKEGKQAIFEPSGLIKPSGLEKPNGLGKMSAGVKAQERSTPSVSTEPNAATAQEQQQQKHPDHHQQ